MRIMGIDAGLDTTGVAVLDTLLEDFVMIEKIRSSKKKATPTTGKRVRHIVAGLSHVIMEHEVDVVVIEDIFVNPRQPSAIIPVARLRGGIEQMVYDWEFEQLKVFQTKVMKLIMTGKGNASKEECFQAILAAYPQSSLLRSTLGLTFLDTTVNKIDDMSDACCLAHAFRVMPEQTTIA